MNKFLQPRSAFLCAVFSLFSILGFSAGHTASIINVTHNSCFNACNGSATGTVTGGVGPFTYAWFPSGGTSTIASGLCAGGYTFVVTDGSDGSTATATTQIFQPTPVTISVTNVTPSTCNQANGFASVIATGGTTPYTYAWSPSGGTAPTITNIIGGSYTVFVTDINGCTAVMSVTVPNIAGPSVIIPNPGTICSGQTVVLSPNVNGGSLPYTCNWTPSANLSSPNVMNPIATPTTTTTYTIAVTDANGCAATATTTVIVSPSFQSAVNTTQATCNQANGSATASITSGGTAPFTYSWSNSATTAAINNITAGSYTVNITDAGGCTDMQVANVPNVGGPAVTATAQASACANSGNGMVTASASGNAPPFTYTWLTNPQVFNDTASGLAPGTYTVQVTDNAGCISFQQTTVTQIAGNLYMYAYTTSFANCNTASGSANSIVSGGTAPYSYLWSDGSTAQNLVAVVAGSYTLTVSDANGCTVNGSLGINNFCVSVISGKYFNDLNNNCVYDPGEVLVGNGMVQLQPAGLYTFTNANGDYQFALPQNGAFTVSPVGFQNPYYTTNCPVSGSHSFTVVNTGDTVSNLDFGRVPVSGIQDLQASIISGAARPGFIQYCNITYRNVGTIPMSDTVFYWHDSLLSLVSSNPPMDYYAAPMGYWLFNNLLPSQVQTVGIQLQVPTIQNGGYLGRQLISNVLIEPTATDTTPTDNGDDEVDVIVGSWDPNLKEVWAPDINPFGDILLSDTLLAYTIGFQNTGTDTAFTVVVKDTLPAQLDITTIMPGASSHPYTLELQTLQNGQNELTFSFFNILLADSFVNEPASHGDVKFRIKRMPGLPVGTVISNTAHNYFDFNPPVATNTLNTMIVQPLGAAGNNSAEGITVFPNPFNENTTLVLDKTQEFNVELFDLSGRRVMQSGKQNGNRYIIKRNGLDSGVYLCRIIRENMPAQVLRIVIQ